MLNASYGKERCTGWECEEAHMVRRRATALGSQHAHLSQDWYTNYLQILDVVSRDILYLDQGELTDLP